MALQTQNTNIQNTLQNQDEKEMLGMLDLLVASITGKHIDEYQEDEIEEVVNTCKDYFMAWIEYYVAKKYGKRDSLRLKAIYATGGGLAVFDKFGDLGTKFDEAWDAFFENIKERNEKLLQEAK
jgi:hypothetical protein